MLSTLARTVTAADVVKEAKRGSSLWLKTRSPDLCDFAWLNGYGLAARVCLSTNGSNNP